MSTSKNLMLRLACLEGRKIVVMNLIDDGADDFNSGIRNATAGLLELRRIQCSDHRKYTNYREIIVLLLERKADINSALLNSDDILYLIQRGVIEFGKYKYTETYWRTWLDEINTELDNVDIIPDIAKIISNY